MTNCRVPQILSLGLVFLLLPTTSAEPDWDEAPREPTFDAQEGAFHYVAAQELTEGRNWVEVDFTLQPPRLHFGFVSTEPGAQALVDLDVDFVAVHEFVDEDDDGAFEVDERSLQRIPLAALEPATLTTDTLTPVGYEAVASYPLPSAADGSPLPVGSEPGTPGRLELVFRFSPESRTEDGLDPTELQYDLRLTGFPFRSNDTRLAFEFRLVAAGEASARANGFAVRSAPFEVVHEWMGDARVDGRPVAAAVTLVQTVAGGDEARPDEARTVFLAAPRGTQVEMDPLVGVARDPQPATLPEAVREVLGDGRLFLSALVLSGLAMAVATAVRLRRR